MNSAFDPYAAPTRAGLDATVPQAATVTGVNGDGTVDVRSPRARSSRQAVPVVDGLTVAVGDRVVLIHLDADPQFPLVLARL